MAMHVIFLVHGAGHYTPKGKPDAKDAWFDEAEKSIKDAFASHDFLKDKAFEERFEFERVVYDDFFDQLIQEWAAGAKKYFPLLEGNPLVQQLFKFIEGGGKTDDNFLWTNVADVFLYAAFGAGSKLVRPAVISRARAQVTARLKQLGMPHWSVVAHSLGTAVAHDVLATLDQSPDYQALERPRVAAMIANLSRTLESGTFGGDVYTSAVRPGAGVKHYLSAVHRWDPISLFKQFDPPSSLPGWKFANNPASPVDEHFDKIHGLNHFVFPGSAAQLPSLKLTNPITHKFSHYFAHPKVHLTYFKRADPGLMIKNSQITDASAAFAKKQNKQLEDLVKAAFDDVNIGDNGNASVSDYLDFLKLVFTRWS